jgi:hypothetical protein
LPQSYQNRYAYRVSYEKAEVGVPKKILFINYYKNPVSCHENGEKRKKKSKCYGEKQIMNHS